MKKILILFFILFLCANSYADKKGFSNGCLLLDHISTPTAPPSGQGCVYTKTDDNLYFEDDLGNERLVQDSGIIHYAQIYAENVSDSIALAAQDTFYQITSFTANGISNGATPDHTNDHITIDTTANYEIGLNTSSHSSQANDYEYAVKLNNGASECDNLKVHRTTSNANAIGSSNTSGFCALSANDTVEAWVQRTDGGAVSKTLIIDHITLKVKRLN
jgi:hypothetical protein